MLMLTGLAVRERSLALAGRIATATGARIIAQGSNARIQRGAGRVPIERLPYPVDQALAVLKDVRHLILVGAKAPVAFFAYPDKPSILTPDGCQIHPLASIAEDSIGALEALAEAVGAKKNGEVVQPPGRPALPTGALTPDTLAAALGALLPEGAIVSDESVTSGRGFFKATAGAPPHDWMNNMGGSIGLGLPLATGAAVACPDRKVVCLEGDGSGMYTLQALWTQAREGLDVTTVVFANRTYAILRHELSGVRAGTPGPKAADMLDIGRPDLDWVALARGMGVPASRAITRRSSTSSSRPGSRPPAPTSWRPCCEEGDRARPRRAAPQHARAHQGDPGRRRHIARQCAERDDSPDPGPGPGRLQRGVREVFSNGQARPNHRDGGLAQLARAADRDHGHRLHPRLIA